MAYSGEMQLAHPGRRRDRRAARRAADQGHDRAGLRTALDPSGSWMPSVLARRRPAALGGTAPRPRRRAGSSSPPTRSPPAPTPSCCAQISGEAADGGALRREGGLEEDRRVHATARTGGWSRSGWCPRASTCPGWRSASTRPRPRRRCSSRRPSGASCGPAGAARPRRCSCPRCRTCSASPPRWRSSATTSSRRRVTDEDRHLRRRAGPARPGQHGGGGHRRARDVLRGTRLAGDLRPGALRRRRVRPLGRGARRLRGGDGLPRHPRPAGARPGARAAAQAAEPSARASRSRPRRRRTPSPRSPPTSSWRSCAGS